MNIEKKTYLVFEYAQSLHRTAYINTVNVHVVPIFFTIQKEHR